MKNPLFRISFFLAGLICVCVGIVLCKKCALGISPISSIPYVLSLALPLSFGQFTMLFHFVNIAGQMILQKSVRLKTSLQILLALVFSTVIDFFDSILSVPADYLPAQLEALILSIVFTALGMVLMVHADLIQNPVDGFVKQVAERVSKPLGTVKICYDLSCVVISLLLSMLLLRRLEGFGLATITSAVFVGKYVGWIRALASRFRKT